MISEETLTILSQLSGKPMTARDAENIFLHLNKENAFAPHVMIASLVDLLHLNHGTQKELNDIQSVFADILARDRHTGYYIHSALRTLYLDFAMVRSGLRGQENRNFLILGDFMNLSSVNDAIGRGTTNDVMATVCGIYVDCMIRAGITDWIYHRSMGDEVTFVVINTDESIVAKGLEEADKTTREFIQSLGLDRLRHKKYPDQSGTGLISARVNLHPNMDHRHLKQELDALVVQIKSARHKRRWFEFKRQSVEPDQFHNRSSQQRIDKTLHKYREYRSIPHQAGTPDEHTPIRDQIHPAKSLLVGRAIAWPRDDRIEYLRRYHNDTKTMLRADIYNLGGLNAIFGHDGADHVKSHLVRILHSTLSMHDLEEPRIFDCGGGIIDIVFNTTTPKITHKIVSTIQSNIYHQILCHTVEDYAQAHNLSFSGSGRILLARLSHPRQEQEGTGLVMAVHNVESNRYLPEIIERIDKITHRTKMHGFSYIWTDESNHVFGLPLNEVPDPVFIGNERMQPSRHYLPFTDALRHYLEEEDLSDIFERPVGQICETLFGTDMQAVLGFKKAIGLLQEKEVAIERIAAIRSYDQMDALLKSENLPPLSVVSTQNRPSFIQNEPAAFRTMALAEKLENLPGAITRLILQAQACFRTLKIVQPHGHLATAQAALILQEEIQQVSLPEHEINKSPINAQLTESLYALARLFDRGYTAIDKHLPDPIRIALTDISLRMLDEIGLLFIKENEVFLGEKLQNYVVMQETDDADLVECLDRIHQEIHPLLDRLRKKSVLEDETQIDTLQNRIESLWNIMRHNIEDFIRQKPR